MIKQICAFAGATTLLAACMTASEMNVLYKQGSLLADRQRVLDECEFESVKAIPRAMAVEMTGGFSSPGTLQCNTIGGITSCNQVGAVNIPATAQSYDANAETRSRYMARCLLNKGYTVLKRPICKTDTEIATAQAADRKPQASESQISCGIPTRRVS